MLEDARLVLTRRKSATVPAIAFTRLPLPAPVLTDRSAPLAPLVLDVDRLFFRRLFLLVAVERQPHVAEEVELRRILEALTLWSVDPLEVVIELTLKALDRLLKRVRALAEMEILLLESVVRFS